MGRAVTYCKIAAAKMEKCKPFVNCLAGTTYATNYGTKVVEINALRDKAISENK